MKRKLLLWIVRVAERGERVGLKIEKLFLKVETWALDRLYPDDCEITFKAPPDLTSGSPDV